MRMVLGIGPLVDGRWENGVYKNGIGVVGGACKNSRNENIAPRYILVLSTE